LKPTMYSPSATRGHFGPYTSSSFQKPTSLLWWIWGDGDPTILVALMAVVRRVETEVTLEQGATRVLTNLGWYQDSKHLHFHVNFGDPGEPAPNPSGHPRPSHP
jgi:hypothetical protein